MTLNNAITATAPVNMADKVQGFPAKSPSISMPISVQEAFNGFVEAVNKETEKVSVDICKHALDGELSFCYHILRDDVRVTVKALLIKAGYRVYDDTHNHIRIVIDNLFLSSAEE